MIDIGKDLQNAFDEGYKQGRYDEKVETKMSLPEWIPVGERLPKEYAQYLVCFEDGECYVYWLEDSDWSRGVAEKEGILAWMPLPEPYREDGGDDE